MHGRIGNWKTKVDVFSLGGLINWLEKQPPDTKYEFTNCSGNCLIAHYLREQGCKGDWTISYQKFPYQLRLSVAGLQPHTFGAALARARAALKDSTP